jgi:hypothetical protein
VLQHITKGDKVIVFKKREKESKKRKRSQTVSYSNGRRYYWLLGAKKQLPKAEI